MDIVTTVLSWIVALVCIYLAYVAVREVEQAVVRRPFSLLLTLVLVVITAGLLLTTLTPVTSVLLEPYSYSDLGDHWYTFILVALIAGAIVLIWRDVARRVRRAACPQCGTPLMGHVACPSCDWGSLPLLGAVVGRARQATATVASAPMPPAPAAMAGVASTITRTPAPSSSASAPTMVGTPLGTAPAPASPAASATQAATFCAQCGTAIAAGASFCPRCGAPTA